MRLVEKRRRVPDSPSVRTDPHLRRNFALGLLNGAMFNFAEALMSVDTVLTWFVQRLGGSNFLIGLVGPMRDAGWFLPQLFMAHRLQRDTQPQAGQASTGA